MMRQGDFLFIQKSIQETAGTGRLCFAVRVTETDCVAPGCGRNPYDDSAYNSSCAVCHGTGTVRTEVRYPFKAIVEWVDANTTNPWATAAISMGDLFIRCTPRTYLLLGSLGLDDYMIVDSITVRTHAAKQLDVGNVVADWLLSCNKVRVI